MVSTRSVLAQQLTGAGYPVLEALDLNPRPSQDPALTGPA